MRGENAEKVKIMQLLLFYWVFVRRLESRLRSLFFFCLDPDLALKNLRESGPIAYKDIFKISSSLA